MKYAERFLSAARRNPPMAVALLLILLSVWALLPRIAAERSSRSTGIVLDFRDLAAFAAREGKDPETVWPVLAESGATGIMVSELTGGQLSLGALPLYYGPASGLPPQAAGLAAPDPSRTALFLPKTLSSTTFLPALLSARFPGAQVREFAAGVAVLLPRSLEDLMLTGVLPDVDGLLLASKHDIPVFYRIAPALPPDTGASLKTLEGLLAAFPQIRTVSPSGEVALGYPDLRPLAGLVAREGRSVAMVEFSRQVGAPQLNWLSFPRLLPLHSVTNEEILSRNISRFTLYERFLRAVKERSVRLLVFRPSAMEAAESPFDAFVSELRHLASGLTASGAAVQWPEPFAPWSGSFAGALALALALVFSMLRFLQRFFFPPAKHSADDAEILPWRTTPRGLLLFAGIVFASGSIIFLIPSAARVAGALAAVFVVTEASFLALDGWRLPWLGILGSFLFAVAGGLAIAAFFSDPSYVLRLRSFSGVKATLFLPPLLVLLTDLKRRVHPESLGDIFRRPPLWGEIFLLVMLLGGAALVLFRSDNVQFVPAFEVRLREFLERVLVARPRNKEVFLGYPALLVWYFVRKADLWPRYREVFRMGTVLGFSSAVNSFCHFHTPLYFILFRQFNGLWTGVLLGMICIMFLRFVLLPLWDRYGGMVTE